MSKVISDAEGQIITAIVDEDQLSLAIGRNGQNVRLASQLIGWQIDLYSSREWLERGADLSLFGEGGDEGRDVADFALAELDLAEDVVAALAKAGHTTFLEIIDLEASDLLAIEGLGGEQVERLRSLIDQLTIDETGGDEADGEEADGEAASTAEDAEEEPAGEVESDEEVGDAESAVSLAVGSTEEDAGSNDEADDVEAKEDSDDEQDG